MSHPDENIESKFAKDKNFVEKVGEQKEPLKSKYVKGKTGRSVVNSEDFPSL